MSKFVTQTESKLNNARVAILSIVIFSIINIFAIAFGDMYFLFSTYLPQIFISIAVLAGDQTLLIVMVIVSLVYILPYLLCWIFSKKHVGWMIGALVLFSVDSLFFLIDLPSFLTMGVYSIFLDLIIRIYALVCLIMGVVFGLKQSKEKETGSAGAQVSECVANEIMDNSFSFSAETRQLTLSRKKSFIGCAVAMIVYVNRQEVGRLKNGETQALTVPANSFELGVVFSSGMAGNSVQISAGEQDLKYQTSIKSGFWANKILLDPID